jgi:hypothetical protein
MSGDLLTRYCPRRGQCDPFQLWLWIAVVSMASPVLMVVFSPFLRTKVNDEIATGDDAGKEMVSAKNKLFTRM